jgi:type VI secretion system secreted protein Hcp
MSDLTVRAHFSKASPQLLLTCATGKHVKSAVLTARRSGKAQTDFLTFSLSDVLVSPYQTGGVSAEMPLDSISLSFSKIEVSYKEQKTDGSLGPAIRVGWDRKTNKQL